MAVSNDWWRGATIYQIYPRSYRDSNSDGVGDLPGITEKLSYIASLGVDAIWISPFMKSPMKDFGYDVSDYCDVDPLFGTLDDFKIMLDKAHGLNLKIIVDMIFSHTSDQHAWFQESRKSRDNAKSEWYVWADPREDGSPPNNWVSVFGGSSWQYDSWRGQYYMHNFLKEQPDLNYLNPEVQDAMLGVMKFWLDLGVDGFRLDAINYCFHDRQLRNNPPRPVVAGAHATQLDFVDPYSMQWHQFDKSQPEMLDYLRRIRTLLDQYPGTMALGEIGDDDEVGRAIEYSGDGDKLHTCYNFTMINTPARSARAFRTSIEAFESKSNEAWPSWAFSNHDVVRAVSRWAGKFSTDPVIAKMLVAVLTSLRGTAFLYQGEELGLPDTIVAYNDIQDPWGKYLYPKWQGRDGCRTPMAWDASQPHLGFSDGDLKPWLPINESYAPITVASQETDSNSTLNFTRAFLAWRKTAGAMVTGEISFFDIGLENVLGFTRMSGDVTHHCLFNFTGEELRVLNPARCETQPVFEWPGQTGACVDGHIVLPPFGFFIS